MQECGGRGSAGKRLISCSGKRHCKIKNCTFCLLGSTGPRLAQGLVVGKEREEPFSEAEIRTKKIAVKQVFIYFPRIGRFQSSPTGVPFN